MASGYSLYSFCRYTTFGSPMPNRKINPGSYRYGFNGKENDEETGTQDYGMRIYDTRIAKFLSVDPIAIKYPMLTSYQFASNSPISGVDIDGLEYMTIVRFYAFGAKTPVTKLVWYDAKHNNLYGPKGEGILVQEARADAKGNVKMTEKMYKKDSPKGDHGFYCGPTQLPAIQEVKNYTLPSIDAVDEAGRIHDMAYDAVGATADNGMSSWGTIEADLGIIKASAKVAYFSQKKLLDPYNKQPITQDEINAAAKVIVYFEYASESKIDDVSDWMQNNYKDISKNASGFWNDSEADQKYNYEKFRDIYMHKDGNVWKLNEGMWNTDKNGLSTPKTPEELKKKK